MRTILYVASGVRRSTRYWTFVRTTLTILFLALAIIMLVFVAFGQISGGNIGASLGLGLFYLFLSALSAAAPAVSARSAARRVPGLVGPHTFRIDPEGFLHRTTTTEVFARWAIVIRHDFVRGDIFLFTNPRLAQLIPRHAFASEEEARRFYDTIVGNVDAARRLGLGPAEVDALVWPPPPQAPEHNEPPPEIGPPLDPDRVFCVSYTLTTTDWRALGTHSLRPVMLRITAILVLIAAAITLGAAPDLRLTTGIVALLVIIFILGYLYSAVQKAMLKQARAVRATLLDQNITTDFVHLKLRTPESSTSYVVSRLVKVRETDKHIFIYISPAAAVLVPKRAFSSSDDAQSFTSSLRAGLKRGG